MKKSKTDTIYSTALTYACFIGGQKKVDENLLDKMLKDFCLLSDEYGYDYKQEFKNILESKSEINE
jgi:hypothetical protein